MTPPVWTDNPYGLSGQVNVVGEATIGTETNPLTKLYVEDLVVTGSEDSEGGQTAPSFTVADTTIVLDENGLDLDDQALLADSAIIGGVTIDNGVISGATPLRTVSAAVSAAGTDSTNATVLTAGVNNISTVAASTGVRLFAVGTGGSILVKNSGANALLVYPTTGGTINAGVVDAGVSIATGATAVLTQIAALTFIGFEAAAA